MRRQGRLNELGQIKASLADIEVRLMKLSTADMGVPVSVGGVSPDRDWLFKLGEYVDRMRNVIEVRIAAEARSDDK